MATEPAISPCAHCGMAVTGLLAPDRGTCGTYSITCRMCRAEGPRVFVAADQPTTVHTIARHTAIRAWNTRSADGMHGAALGALRNLMDELLKPGTRTKALESKAGVHAFDIIEKARRSPPQSAALPPSPQPVSAPDKDWPF